jgi:hypothetical protein
MNSEEYKRITNQWNVKRRNLIEDSLALVEKESEELAEMLRKTLVGVPIENPTLHTGDMDTDYFKVQMSEEEMQNLIDLLFELEAASVPKGDGVGFEKEAFQAGEASRIALLVNEWNKLNVD